MRSANIWHGWQKIKLLIKSWKIKYDSGLLTIVTDSERAKIGKYFQEYFSLQWDSFLSYLWRSPNMWKLCCSPFLSATENFVKLLNKSHRMFPMSLLDPCLSQMRTWHSPWAAVIWFFMQFFCLSKVLQFWISRGESHSNSPCEEGETQMTLAPHGACLRHEHRLPCIVPHWQKSQKAAPKVLSLLYFPSWYMHGATSSHFKVLSSITLGLTLCSEENWRSCCSVGKSSHQGSWIHAWDYSHGPESASTSSRNLSSLV